MDGEAQASTRLDDFLLFLLGDIGFRRSRSCYFFRRVCFGLEILFLLVHSESFVTGLSTPTHTDSLNAQNVVAFAPPTLSIEDAQRCATYI